MNAGIAQLAERLNQSISPFTVKEDKTATGVVHHWYLGINAPNCSNETLAKLLDRYLCQLNDDYQTVRKTGLLSQVRVTTFSPQVFYDWQAKQGKLGGQAKFPTVMTDAQYADWVAFVKSRIKGSIL